MPEPAKRGKLNSSIYCLRHTCLTRWAPHTDPWTLAYLARISHHLTVEARHRPAITALRLLAVLNVLFKYARIIQEMRRRASRALY